MLRCLRRPTLSLVLAVLAVVRSLMSLRSPLLAMLLAMLLRSSGLASARGSPLL